MKVASERMRGCPVAGDTAHDSVNTASILRRCEVRIGARVKSSPSLSLPGLLSRSVYNLGEWLDQVEASHVVV